MINMEACANSVSSGLMAQEGGAVRIELCDNLAEGGTTPSYGQINMAKQKLAVAVYPIIRPRGGDFLYTDLEFEVMKRDVEFCRSAGCDGVVTGILKADGSVDRMRCAELIGVAGDMPVAFHRAFDMSRNLFEALEDVITLGFERVLTSGGAASAIEGAEVIAKLISQAAGRIDVMPGAGINPDNIKDLIRITGAKEFHATAKCLVNSKMEYRHRGLQMGVTEDEYRYELTDSSRVKALLELANLRKLT